MAIKDHLSFFSLNIEGLADKFDDPQFISTFIAYDFVILLETWLPTNFQVSIPKILVFFGV